MAIKRVRLTSKFFLLLVAILTFANFAIPTPAQAAPALPPLPGTGALVTNVPTLTGVGIAVKDTVKAVKELLAAITSTQTALQTTANGLKEEIAEIIVNAKDDPQGAAAAIQAAITSALPGLEGTILTQALALVSKIAGPVCPIVGAAASAVLPNIGLPTMPDYSLFGPLAAPVKQIDQGVSDALYNFYVGAIAQLLAPVALPPGTEALAPYVGIAQALLGLLRINWHTVLRPSDGGPTITRDTPAFLNLPMVIDTDRNVGVDVCANLGLDLTTLNVTQQIDRVPLSNPHSQLDITANVLGLINVGYETPNVLGSHMPTMFETTTTLTGNPADSYVVQPGSVFSQLIGFATPINLTTQVAAGIIAKTTGNANITIRLGTVNTPTHYIYKSVAAGGGTTASFWGSEAGAGWSNKTRTILTGVIQGYSTATNPPTPIGSPIPLNTDTTSGQGFSPQATYSEVCTSSSSGACNTTAPPALRSTETTSMRLRSLIPATYHTYSTPDTTTACPTDTHITATIFTYGAKIPTSSSTAGHAWVDTDGRGISGCQGANATYPGGFVANDRLATWNGTAANTPATSKSGDITCPAGTLIKSGSVTTSNYLCKFPPANTALPVISGYPNQSFPLTASTGTWTPSAPNAPSFAYQWMVCDAAGNNCTDIGGANTNTYVPTAGDLGKTIRVKVTATNLDGTASATSAQTVPITVPAPAFNSDPPVARLMPDAPALVVRTSNGSWGGYPNQFTYQWQLCDSLGENCVDIPGETNTSYTPVVSDQGKTVRVVVTGCNIGGCNSANSNAVRVPFPPQNTAPPVIKNGNTDVTGQAVNAGDHLTVTDGTWVDPGPFTYQWFTCDLVMPTMETDCTAIPGATANTYTASNDDVGHRLTAAVRTSNPNGNASQLASPTGLVVANAFLEKPVVDVVDGAGYTAEESDHESTYVGGGFDTVGALNRRAGALSLNAVSTPTGTPVVSAFNANARGGDVFTVVSDNAGGYFLGGSFTSVRGNACKAFAHIDNTGAFDASYCNLIDSGEVRAIAVSTAGAKLIGIGGNFVSGSHNNMLWVDPAGSHSTPFFATDGDPNGVVKAISVSSTGNGFYIGGAFSQVGATPKGSLVLEVVTVAGMSFSIGRTTQWNAAVCKTTNAAGACTDVGVVNTLTVTPLFTALIGGDFNGFYKMTDATPGSVTTWRNNALAVGLTAGATLAGWSPNTDGPVNAIAGVATPGVAPGNAGPYTLYLGGSFHTIGGTVSNGASLGTYGGGQSVSNLAEFGITSASGNPNNATAGANAAGPAAAFSPAVDGPVTSLVAGVPSCTGACVPQMGLFIGGQFKHVMGQERNRLALLAPRQFDTNAQAVLDNSFQPAVGRDVYSITRDANNLFVGGHFNVLGGVVRDGIAEFGGDGHVTTWKPDGVDGDVFGLARSGSTLYAGGNFVSANDEAATRHYLAAFNTTTGALTSWNPNADGGVWTLEPDGAGGVYAGGYFDHIGALARSNAAQIDASGAATAWTADTDDDVRAISVSGGVVYLGGIFHTAGGLARAGLAAFNQSGGITGWNPGTSGGFGVFALAATGDGVWVGGDFDHLGGLVRNNIGFVDLAGATTAVDPNADDDVWALRAAGSKVFVGGEFTSIGGFVRGGAAQLEANGTANDFNPLIQGPVLGIAYSAAGLVTLVGDFSKANLTDTMGIIQYGA